MGWLLIVELLVVLLLLGGIVFCIIFITRTVRGFLQTYFHADNLKDAIENSKIEDENTHKSISSMESIYLDKIDKDFPDMNLNELKSKAEANIINVLDTIEAKNMDKLKNKNEKVVEFTQNKIDDLKDEKVTIDDIKIHKTLLSKYEVSGAIATIEISSSLEYFYKKGKDVGHKVQTRFKTEFIYIIDVSKLHNNVKGLGLNCPNCGAPVKSLGHKHCDYCNTGIVEIVNRVWIINNIKEY
jgi:hypothetical protein